MLAGIEHYYLFVEVGDHGCDGEREAHSLEGVHGVSVEQEGQD